MGNGVGKIKKNVLVLDTGVLGHFGKELLKETGFKKFQWYGPPEESSISHRFWERLTSERNQEPLEKLNNYDLIVLATHVRSHYLGLLINEACLKMKMPFVFLRLAGMMIGSLHVVLPEESPCIACLEAVRLRYNSGYKKEVELEERVTLKMWKNLQPSRAAQAMLSALLSLEISRIFNDPRSALTANKELEIYFGSLQTTLHKVDKIPRCHFCSLSAKVPPELIQNPFVERWKFDEKKKILVPA